MFWQTRNVSNYPNILKNETQTFISVKTNNYPITIWLAVPLKLVECGARKKHDFQPRHPPRVSCSCWLICFISKGEVRFWRQREFPFRNTRDSVVEVDWQERKPAVISLPHVGIVGHGGMAEHRVMSLASCSQEWWQCDHNMTPTIGMWALQSQKPPTGFRPNPYPCRGTLSLQLDPQHCRIIYPWARIIVQRRSTLQEICNIATLRGSWTRSPGWDTSEGHVADATPGTAHGSRGCNTKVMILSW